MYSDKKNILQLVALLRAHGVTKVVLCPGKPECTDCTYTCRTSRLHLLLGNRRAECRLFCYRACFAGRNSCRCLLHIGHGFVEFASCHSRGLLPESIFSSYFRRSSCRLDQPDGRTDFTSAGCFPVIGEEVCRSARNTYGRG